MRFFLLLGACLVFTQPVLAQQPGEQVLEAGKAVFSEMERRVIREVLNRTGLPDVTQTKEDKNDDRDRYSHKGRDRDRDEDDDDRQGKKDKGDKHKDKDKAKGKDKGLPPGLAKKKELPPGLAKRSTLPPGLQKEALPQELEDRLPPPPAGTERVIVDSSVILVEKGTEIILDVIENVLTK